MVALDLTSYTEMGLAYQRDQVCSVLCMQTSYLPLPCGVMKLPGPYTGHLTPLVCGLPTFMVSGHVAKLNHVGIDCTM